MIATLAPPRRRTASGTAVEDRDARKTFEDAARRLCWIDLSLPLEPTPYEAGPLRVDYVDHRRGGDQLGLLARVPDCGSFARLAWAWLKQRLGWRALRARDFPGGIGLASEHFRSLSSHHGTHLDAPWHYGPRCAGRPARTVDELPMDWCFAPGLRVDVRRRGDPAWIRLRDVRRALCRDGRVVRPGRIVLLQTGMDRWWGTPRYLTDAPGVDPHVVAWLADRGVRVIGIDAFGFDRPFAAMYRDFRQTRDPRVLWPAHLAGRAREYCQIEKLARLDALPGPEGFWVSCLPVRIARGGAAWVRAAAAVPVAGEGIDAGTA
jgi:cyclase